MLYCVIIRTIMEHVRSKDLGTSANYHIEPTSYTEYMTWYNDEELVEMPSEKEQQTQRTLTVQKMGVKAHEAARLASCIEAQGDDPNMSLKELAQTLQEIRALNRHVNEELRESERREDAYDRNRRTSRFPGLAVIANAAIA